MKGFSECIFVTLHNFTCGAIAQLARAPALQAGGPGFESPSLHQGETRQTISFSRAHNIMGAQCLPRSVSTIDDEHGSIWTIVSDGV